MAQVSLTPVRVRELLDYDPSAGVWTWKCIRRPGGVLVAGAIDSKGYRQITIDGVRYLSSRLAVMWMRGYWPSEQVDHINLVRDDDRWENLREATRSQNFANQRVYASNKLGVKGVSLVKSGRFIAQIQVGQKKMFLGRFDTIEDASRAYTAAAKDHFGEYART